MIPVIGSTIAVPCDAEPGRTDILRVTGVNPEEETFAFQTVAIFYRDGRVLTQVEHAGETVIVPFNVVL